MIMSTSTPLDRAMLDARFSHLYFCQSLHTLQSALADLLVNIKFTCAGTMKMFL